MVAKAAKGTSTAGAAAGAETVLSYGPLPELLGFNLRRAQVAVFADFAATVGDLGLTPGQVGVLLVIEANEGLKQTALAKAFGLDRSTIVTVIDKLEGRDLVRRDPAPNDRRSHALKLTLKGRRTLARLRPKLDAHERNIASGLSAAERKTFLELLRRVAGVA